MSPETLRSQIEARTAQLVGRPLDAGPDDRLNQEHGPESDALRALADNCRSGVAGGWLHKPTVSGGRARVPGLLPDGEIRFTP